MPEEMQSFLKPVTDLFPEGVQEFLNSGGWWAVLGVLALIVLLVLLALVAAVWRTLFRRKQPPLPDPEAKLQEDLATYVLPEGLPNLRRLTIEGVPARLRLIVLAPVGKDARIDPTATGMLLDSVLHGLGGIIQDEQPTVRIWPPQLSNQGFSVIFHRVVKKPEPEGQLSRWALIAGRTPPHRPPLLIGLALYTDAPTRIGRLTIEPDRWSDVLRIKTRD
jgi:hypothetical protein